MMSLIAIKSDYIYKANNVYINLKEYEDIFELEALVLTYAKCYLIQNNELNDFIVNGIYVCTYGSGNNYELYFDNYVMKIDVYERMIIDYSMKRL